MLEEDRICGVLICRTCILQAKGYHGVALHSQCCSEGCMLLVSWIQFDLIISGESIHEGHHLKTARIVNHDIRDRERLSKNYWRQVLRRGPHSNVKVAFQYKTRTLHPTSNADLASNFKPRPQPVLRSNSNTELNQLSRSNSNADLSQFHLPTQIRTSADSHLNSNTSLWAPRFNNRTKLTRAVFCNKCQPLLVN